MLSDLTVLSAISRIRERSEREDIDRLVQSYVECGVLTQIGNENNQVVFGRRGTGKTHVLRYYVQLAEQQKDTAAVYVDMRSLGSAGLYVSDGTTAAMAALSAFKDMLARIHDCLFEYVHETGREASGPSIQAINRFADQVVLKSRRPKEGTDVDQLSTTEGHGGGLTAGAGPSLMSVSASLSSSVSSAKETSSSKMYEEYDGIEFSGVAIALGEAAKQAGVRRLTLVLDEWTAMHPQIQLYMAEYIKRTLLHLPFLTIKIGALEYRSNFGLKADDGTVTGFELGGDITANVELDDYFVYDRDSVRVEQFFRSVLYKHLATELPENYLGASHNIKEPDDLCGAIFTGPEAFKNLVRAAEGVVRDFLQIFCLAAYDSASRQRGNISVPAVVKSAQRWYERDKYGNLNPKQQQFLEFLVDKVIGEHKARSFLLDRRYELHHMIRSLVDARVLHIMRRGYSDKNKPGTRSNVYTLDYGTYVGLRSTKREPQTELEFTPERETDYETVVVPFDDFRAIRRVVLDPSWLPG